MKNVRMVVITLRDEDGKADSPMKAIDVRLSNAIGDDETIKPATNAQALRMLIAATRLIVEVAQIDKEQQD